MTAPRGVPASLLLFRTDKASYREVNTSKELCMKYLFHQKKYTQVVWKLILRSDLVIITSRVLCCSLLDCVYHLCYSPQWLLHLPSSPPCKPFINKQQLTS